VKKVLKEERLRALTRQRVIKGYDQEELANLLGISRSHYTKIERGLIDPPTTLALKIAKLLDSSVEHLFHELEETLPHKAAV